MGPFDFLVNGAQGITPPQPYQLAGGALNLANLSNAAQSGAINLAIQRYGLQAMQDPRFAGAMGQLLSGDAGSVAGGNDGDFQSLFAANPIGMMSVLGQRAQVLSSLSQVQKNQADAAKAQTDARIAANNQFANLAYKYGNSTAPLDPVQQRMMFRLAMGAQLSPGMMQDMVTAFASPDGGREWAAQYAASGARMGEQTTAETGQQKMPYVGPQAAADVGKTTEEAQQAAARARLFNVEGSLAPYKAAVDVANLNKPTVVTDANGNPAYLYPFPSNPVPMPAIGGTPLLDQALAGATGSPATAPQPSSPFAPQNAQEAAALAAVRAAGGQPAAFMATASGPQNVTAQVTGANVGPTSAATPTVAPNAVTPTAGGNVQLKLTPAQESQKDALTAQLKEVNANTQTAQRVLQILPTLQSFMQSGYTGTFAGSETGKALLNALATAHLLPDSSLKALANMRASDALTAELMGPLAHQLSTRGSNMAIRFVQGVKPGTENSLPVAMQMAKALALDAQNVIRYGNAYNGYATAHPQDLGMSGFVAPTPVTLPPAALAGSSRVDQLPANAPLGSRAYGDDGTQLIFTGPRGWQPVGK